MSTSRQDQTGAAVVTTPTDREIHIERIINAPRDRVWRAHTEPELLAQWWGRGNRLEIERFEPERGGHWRFVEHADGEESQGFEGRFREVTPLDRLVYTFEWDGMPGHVIIENLEFEDLDGRQTRLVTTSLFHTADERNGMLQSGMEQGLNESYDALERVIAATDW
jgi:uncharacterized protein YndB with AHSA1/START domain